MLNILARTAKTSQSAIVKTDICGAISGEDGFDVNGKKSEKCSESMCQFDTIQKGVMTNESA